MICHSELPFQKMAIIAHTKKTFVEPFKAARRHVTGLIT
jgi:hypothetical protein